jgi:hypothetical protein
MTSTTRRAALTALAGASVLAIPAAAAPNADAALFALQPEIEAADQRETAALKAQSGAEDDYFARQPPKPTRQLPVLGAKEAEALERFRRCLEEADKGPTPHEIAVRDWERECERLAIECGREAAEERTGAAQEAVDAIGRRIAAIRATTLAGLAWKAKYAIAHNEGEADPKVTQSIIDDLLAMSA